MPKHYYAAYKIAPEEVAIFNSREARDMWVRCTDSFSLKFPPIDTDRVALTRSEAEALIGRKCLYDTANYIKDAFQDNMMLAISKNHFLRRNAV